MPLQRRSVIGIVCSVGDSSEVPVNRLRKLNSVLDEQPVFASPLLKLLLWTAHYYHHPVGEVLQAALPVALRQQQPLAPVLSRHWRICADGERVRAELPARYVLQHQVLAALATAGDEGLAEEAIKILSGRLTPVLARLHEQGWIAPFVRPAVLPTGVRGRTVHLTVAQERACQGVIGALAGYAPFLLHGVTGSGKTEVYLRAAAATLAAGRQALVLVPEIALTPQLVQRFREALDAPLAVIHSGLPVAQRHRAWWAAREGDAAVVLGTRSAVFTPLADPGLFIVDEEHDPSYKQQEGFRYNARDVMVKRAQLAGIPVILGSATPSLETMANARDGRYRHLALPTRPGATRLPTVRLLNLADLAVNDGLTAPVIAAIKVRLDRGEQSIVYVNRRGFAPLVACSDCGWQGQCRRCDARLTLHRRSHKLVCHHCGATAAAPVRCPQCSAERLYGIGVGTQRIEETLARVFPAARILRLDSDTIRHPARLEAALSTIRSGAADILVGTQLLSKGHDFAAVTLVCVLSTDQGLYSMDFRGPERLFQQLTQVAGRAGRADTPGEVLVQTRHPGNPAYTRLARHDFSGFAKAALAERQAAGYPPFARFALLRAQSPVATAPLQFLRTAARLGQHLLVREQLPSVQLMDPVPSLMERRAGRYRAQLLASAATEAPLHRFLNCWLAALEGLPAGRRVRWSIDVDPQEMY